MKMNYSLNRNHWRITLAVWIVVVATNVAAQTDYDVRLVGSNSAHEGRVEVYKGNAWGTICDDGFDTNDANAICTQLGYELGGNIVRNIADKYGVGAESQPIHIQELKCTGQESSVKQCMQETGEDGGCEHSEDVGVICTLPTGAPVVITNEELSVGIQNTICTNAQVRIRGPDTMSGTGFVEVYHPEHGGWGSVCDDHWDNRDAKVVCKMLCYPDLTLALAGGLRDFDYIKSDVASNILLDDVRCTGTEESVFDCLHAGVGNHNCKTGINGEYASVKCTSTAPIPITITPPLLDCSEEMFTIKFSLATDPHLKEEHLTLYDTPVESSEPCMLQYVRDSSYVTMRFKHHECDTVVSTNETHISYSNHVLYNCTSRYGNVTRMPNVIYKFICDIPRNVSDSIDYMFQILNQTYRAEAEFNINMTMYSDRLFQDRVTVLTPEFPLGKAVTVSVNLINTNPDLWLVVPKCYATARADPNSVNKEVLFDKNCPVENTTCIHPRDDKSVGFEFKTFRFKDSPTVYIYCFGVVCDIDEKSDLCDRSCLKETTTGENRKRRKRRALARTKRSANQIVLVSTSLNVNEELEAVIERGIGSSGNTSQQNDTSNATSSITRVSTTVTKLASNTQGVTEPSITTIYASTGSPTSASKSATRETSLSKNGHVTTSQPQTAEPRSEDAVSKSLPIKKVFPFDGPKDVAASAAQIQGSFGVLSLAVMVSLALHISLDRQIKIYD